MNEKNGNRRVFAYIRNSLGFSTSYFADIIGVTKGTLVKWETGNMAIGHKRVELLSEQFGFDVDILTGDLSIEDKLTIDVRCNNIRFQLMLDKLFKDYKIKYRVNSEHTSYIESFDKMITHDAMRYVFRCKHANIIKEIDGKLIVQDEEGVHELLGWYQMELMKNEGRS